MTQQRFDELNTSDLQVVDRICGEFEGAQGPNRTSIERYLAEAPERIQQILFGELLAFELEVRGRGGSFPDQAEYMARFPDRLEQIHSVFGRIISEHSESRQLHLATAADSAVEADRETEIPDSIGRFRVEKIIGQGGFGIVYKAYDDRLARAVAIKVPLKRFYSRIENRGNYLAEARTVAKLEHPHIVPVYELGSNEEFPLFIVSKYVNGTSLAARVVPKQMGDPIAVTELIATVAEALQYAHQQGLVHRDVKPGNILIDEEGHPHLTDFGLALREEDIGSRAGDSGTPAYMSPEQTQGEGHRVDGRSDVFSLGVVFYELLVGRRPFRGSDKEELLANIANCQPRPPRQYHARLPKELERICLKALSRRPSGRYLTALDMAADLRDYLATATDVDSPTSRQAEVESSIPISSDSNSSFATSSDRQTVAVVPRGLRSFDDHDKDFFLTLLPGPRDRQGLPESIRFWKTRIEETDLNKTFSVGLIYGPSGCGKSSMVKAGLLPQLNSAVNAVYVESPGAGTEATLLQHLRHQCPGLPQDLDLKQSVAALRRVSSKPDQKVLIVIDQFEQWLHANHSMDNGELLKTLRQCDGQHVQCILMVRDDFWLSISRLMQQLDIDLVPGHNIALVDLFDKNHARLVLALFGRAYGKLPANPRDDSKSQKEFLNRAIDDLSQDGKIVGVRLALFAEMLKAKPWEPPTLKEAGGTEGVGVNFLNETFNSRTANPGHRFHREAAQRVLKALLPESGTDIKGRMRSDQELLDVSGYQSQPEQFKSLIKILDADLRLITPTEVATTDDTAAATVAGPTRYYQLTHDYLVHSVRDWLTRKQKETMRGRAELRLAERVAFWSSRPEKRHLPNLFELINILVFTTSKSWTSTERTMLRKATRAHGILWGGVCALLLLVGIIATTYLTDLQRRTDAENTTLVVDSLQEASGQGIAFAIEKMRDLPRAIVIAKLRDRIEQAEGQEKLSLACALTQLGYPEVEAIVAGVINPDTQPTEVANIAAALEFAKAPALEKLKDAAVSASVAKNWQLKTRLAVVTMYLGDASIATEMLRSEPDIPSPREMKLESTSAQRWDPIQRTVFIAEFPQWHGEIEKLARILRGTDNAALRSGICLAIGSVDRVGRQAKQIWQEVLVQWYQNKPDTGTHSAAGWALQNWGLTLLPIERTPYLPREHSWWDMKQLTMLKIPAGRVVRTKYGVANGSIVISQPFWIGDREISIGLYKQFMKDAEPNERPRDWRGVHPMRGQDTDDHPILTVSWEDAILFCNWLSKQHGLEDCYLVEPLELTEKLGEQIKYTVNYYDDVSGQTKSYDRFVPPQEFKVSLVPDADGFRLPTEDEWEYAYRAKTTTPYAFGDKENLPSYAIFATDQPEKCGSLLCNAWGLFDMHGNATELCWVPDELTPSNKIRGRWFRGGNYYQHAWQVVSSDRQWVSSTARVSGFRVALNSRSKQRTK